MGLLTHLLSLLQARWAVVLQRSLKTREALLLRPVASRQACTPFCTHAGIRLPPGHCTHVCLYTRTRSSGHSTGPDAVGVPTHTVGHSPPLPPAPLPPATCTPVTLPEGFLWAAEPAGHQDRLGPQLPRRSAGTSRVFSALFPSCAVGVGSSCPPWSLAWFHTPN